MPRVAAALVLLAGGVLAQQETDVIRMKDGSRRLGIIVEETETEVVLQILVTNAKGAISVSGTIRLARADIAEIRRMPRDAREKLKARAEAFEDRGIDRYLRLTKIAVAPVTVGRWTGVRAAGDLFEVRTTCDEDFARDACDTLQQAYTGYLRHFELRRRGAGLLPVVILADRAQYDEFVTRLLGRTLVNPAFYHSRANLIVACNLVEKGVEVRLKAEIRERQAEMEGLRGKAKEQDRRIEDEVRKARADVQQEVDKARREIRRKNPPNRGEMLRRVRDWEKEQLDRIDDWKEKAEREIAEFRRRVTQGIAECRNAIRHNERVLRDQNRSMFEMLFHECFHAFARNRLFGEREIPRWLNEGMASYFEMSAVEGEELIHGAPNRNLLEAYRAGERGGELPPLASVLRGRGEMFVILHEGAIDRSTRSYAVSWALVHYLSTRATPAQMDRYLSDVAAGADPADALTKALGRRLEALEGDVRAHVATLR